MLRGGREVQKEICKNLKQIYNKICETVVKGMKKTMSTFTNINKKLILKFCTFLGTKIIS